jgi:hypothetical protein
MGYSYIGLKANGATQEQIFYAFTKLRSHKIIEASSEIYVSGYLPYISADQIEEIEIGDDVNETIVRFRDGGFIVFKGKIKIGTILKKRYGRYG